MSNIPFPLKLIIGVTKLNANRTNYTLKERRASANRFMKFMDAFAGLKSPSVQEPYNTSFTATDGHQVALRVFTPAGVTAPLPVWVYFHGGGFMVGSFDVRDNFCKKISEQSHCLVVSVQYRLAPEYPFPRGLNDCYEATSWLAANAHTLGGDGSKLAVGGESAGGNLAAVVSLMARDKGSPAILHQTLLYPSLDFTGGTSSMSQENKGYLLTPELMMAFGRAYLPPGHDRKDPYCSPVYADPQGLPPAVIITAEHDPLRDEGNFYAAKLQEAGIRVVHREYAGMIHDFVLMMPRFLQESRDAIRLVNQELCTVFAVKTELPVEAAACAPTLK
ncbi:alpha/beta hydrolase [Pontibacter chitinilyticus]|uniref:alpha/beta hydrolase n=1 Tax=Pontibacter chitinilyticus TaxID=2674989 RepID=UPI00321A7235